MTTLANRKTRLKFETSTLYRGRALVVEAEPHFLRIRQKGTRVEYSVPYEAIFDAGAKIAYREKQRGRE